MAYIIAESLSLGYEGKIITSDLNFEIMKGDYVCIVGENGAGKTTLMKTLLNLLTPISGELCFGENITQKHVGYLPQQTVIQRDFPASVWEIVLSGNLSQIPGKPFYGKREKAKTRENMERMSIWDLRNHCYRNLSGGQQQRVLLARALCSASQVLILDEPVSGLDPKVSQELYDLIRELNQKGTTIIMVSHDLKAALTYSNKILHIGKKQLYFGTTTEYKTSKAKTLLEKEVID